MMQCFFVFGIFTNATVVFIVCSGVLVGCVWIDFEFGGFMWYFVF